MSSPRMMTMLGGAAVAVAARVTSHVAVRMLFMELGGPVEQGGGNAGYG
jgi:hypothetical protein